MALVTPKTVFIHVQKSAGMTIRLALRSCTGPVYESGAPEVERHYGINELRAVHRGIEHGRMSFGFVRHPVDWLVSRWGWAKRSGFKHQAQHRPKAAALWLYDCWSDVLEEFVENTLERYPGICSQTHAHMLGLWGKRVDAVGRVESLQTDLKSILDMAGEDYSEKLLMEACCTKTNASHAKNTLSNSLVLRIMDAEKLLMDRYYS